MIKNIEKMINSQTNIKSLVIWTNKNSPQEDVSSYKIQSQCTAKEHCQNKNERLLQNLVFNCSKFNVKIQINYQVADLKLLTCHQVQSMLINAEISSKFIAEQMKELNKEKNAFKKVKKALLNNWKGLFPHCLNSQFMINNSETARYGSIIKEKRANGWI